MPILPELGVGITYFPDVEPLLDVPGLLDVVEVEPQTLWQETGLADAPYRVHRGVLDALANLPCNKLVHSVGVPVGGSVRPEPSQLSLLRKTIDRLQAPWASEHLSFNRTPEHSTGFFLPPRQTQAGVVAATESIRILQEAFAVPVAVETGVNYLRPREDEMGDGEFVRAVAESADCGILLDLHNVFANGLNGRQPMDAFFDELPLDRVWEVHIAGGFELEGYWVDAHSGAIPDELLIAAENLIAQLPNLKAIIFEIFPSFLPLVGLDLVRGQLETIRGLWEARGTKSEAASKPRTRSRLRDLSPSPQAWERALGSLVVGRSPGDALEEDLASDPGVGLINRMACEFRASMVVNVYRLTSRLLMLSLGPDTFRTILEDYWSQWPPQLYASAEAEGFIGYLVDLDLAVPHLAAVIRYERALAATLMDGEARVVSFSQDPFPVLRSLAEAKLPDIGSQDGDFEIEITPGELFEQGFVVGSPGRQH
ncbi:MAG TPA: DUF692 family protein [Fimbriimonadaceae bacterium]|nr:DUF692 family protein [Fimbriimonadaceae bacterium]